MTKEWYKAHGYNLSINIDQAAVDRAERDVFVAYVKPILPSVEMEDESIAHELSALAYMLLLERTLKVTRGGTKQKTDANSVNADAWSAMSEQATTAASAVKSLRAMDGAVIDAEVEDICEFYFKSNFFYN